jgi:formylglycine-generating enzyme
MHLLRCFAAYATGAVCLMGFAAPATHAVTIDWVTVGDPGNAADTTGYGAVNYEYQIGKYDVTIGQYTAFLNAVATTDTYALYSASMASDLNIAGISRAGSSGSYAYSVINNGGDSSNRPITYVSWWDAARFSNWMANGQPTGAQSSTTTENGAYNVNGATTGSAPGRNAINPNTSAAPTFYIPTENEWYKAAYYSPVKGGVGSPGYYAYATQSDTAPGNTIGSGANQANYRLNESVYSVTQSSSYSSSQNYLTDVGAFTNSESLYGTFDQSGNVFQWNDLDGLAASGSSRGLRGGSWDNDAFGLSSSPRSSIDPSFEFPLIGFRLASPVAVPEPSTWVMGLAGIACASWRVFRRRKLTASVDLTGRR